MTGSCGSEDLKRDEGCQEKILDSLRPFLYNATGMDAIVEKTLLFDFYGALLTEHQRTLYADVTFNDMSLSEAAEVYGISRQGVHDLLKRCEASLREYENRLGLIRQYETVKKLLGSMETRLTSAETPKKAELLRLLHAVENEIER